MTRPYQSISGTSDGFVFICSDSGVNAADTVVIHSDAEANVNWARILNASPRHVYSDSSDNVWVNTEIFSNDHQWGYYNSSGTFTAQRKLTPPSQIAYTWVGYGVAQEDSSYIYFPGRQYGSISGDSGRDGAAVTIINKSTLAIQDRYYFSYSGGTHTGVGCGVDTSSNIYILGYSTDDSFSINAAKLNSSGTVQWRYRWSGDFLFGDNGVTASDGTSYIVGRNATGGDKGYIIRINNDGSTGWARNISGSSDSALTGVCLTGSGNILISGYELGTPRSVYVAMFNTSGTMQWDAQIDNSAGSSNNMIGYCCDVDDNGIAYVVADGGEVAAGNPSVICLGNPDDGGLTAGTYGNYSVSVPSKTVSTHSPTRSSVSYTVADPGHSDQAGTRTSSSTTIDVTKTDF